MPRLRYVVGVARLTSFNESVLEQVDSSGDIGKSWCRRGRKSFEAKCVLCDLGLIKGGLANKNMEDIECGQVLLADANDSLTENMTRLADINQELQQL
ncbi:hypothetical protein HPB52_000939 [Rhipicephalus sanguineus]|uniref:Uncharacterized protein n=1 Tax=Rhipicephalus sanguineus TaxID=34632 RepID=A0A9D4SRP9_RHISA|nr:hypothetical protein HPB52_000939 [Rhipicephalus sanguineus]